MVREAGALRGSRPGLPPAMYDVQGQAEGE
jgi:hypothetical protein